MARDLRRNVEQLRARLEERMRRHGLTAADLEYRDDDDDMDDAVPDLSMLDDEVRAFIEAVLREEAGE